MSKTQLEDSSWQQLLDHVLHLIEDMEDASVITEWTHAFDIGHRDERYFSFVTTSSCGLTLIMTLLFSAFRVDYSTRPSLKSVVNNLCERLILSVEEMFDHVEHAIVWQLIALLDGFVEATLREKLRMIIKKLIEEQRITLST